jgi:hypothetical protein
MVPSQKTMPSIAHFLNFLYALALGSGVIFIQNLVICYKQAVMMEYAGMAEIMTKGAPGRGEAGLFENAPLNDANLPGLARTLLSLIILTFIFS